MRGATHGTDGGARYVDETEARRIAALKAIVQAMVHEVYAGGGSESARELFALQLEEDEVLALAVANELSEEELDYAFIWAEAATGSVTDAMSANPVVPYLSEEQRTRARVALLAHEEADHAHTVAVRAPGRPNAAPLSDDERVALGEETFLGRIEIDVLHEHEGWSGFTTMAKAGTAERIAHLPEPWRGHAAARLPEIKARIRETLERRRLEGRE